jgi:cobalt-zinc-cadmium efflux system membrane fusion protein
MSVRVFVKIPPKQGRTVIPRSAMVTVDRFDYVFIRRQGTTDQFERRQIFTANEMNDVVIVEKPSRDHPGLAPGQEVVTTGSLILEQLFEDKVMTEGGFLASGDGQKNLATLDAPNISVVTSSSAAQ